MIEWIDPKWCSMIIILYIFLLIFMLAVGLWHSPWPRGNGCTPIHRLDWSSWDRPAAHQPVSLRCFPALLSCVYCTTLNEYIPGIFLDHQDMFFCLICWPVIVMSYFNDDGCVPFSFHLDHCGALPWFLQKTSFKGRTFMTHATKAIYRWLLSDYVKVR